MSRVLPDRRITCPTCLVEFGPDAVTWRDDRGRESAPVPARSTGWSRLRRWLDGSLADPSRRDVIEALGEGRHPTCPLGDRLPPEFLERRTIVVGLVGERGAAKSHYLATLVSSLVDGALTPYGLSAQLAQTSLMDYQRIYYLPLYRDHLVLEPTFLLPDGTRRQPLTVVLRDIGTNRAWNVLFYDASGEQQRDSTEQARYNAFLCAAHVLLLFVTPQSLPDVGVSLPADGSEQTIPATSTMLDTTADLMRRARQLSPDADLSGVSTQVVLAKADVLRALEGFDAKLLEPIDYEAFSLREVLAQVEDDSRALAAFVEQSGAKGLVTNLGHRFDRPVFHAVSPTGCPPVDGTFPQVRPVRVVDPLLVALVQLGLLDPEAR